MEFAHRYAPPMPSLNYTGGFSLGNSARIGPDDNNWPGVLNEADIMSTLSSYAQPGYWNDPGIIQATHLRLCSLFTAYYLLTGCLPRFVTVSGLGGPFALE